jgi:hypothetical protein
MRSVLIVCCLVLLVGVGCSAGADEAAPRVAALTAVATTDPPEPPRPDLTVDQLAALLPSSADAFPWRVKTRCTSAAPTCLDQGHPLAAAAIWGWNTDGAETESSGMSLTLAQFATADEAARVVERARRGSERRYSGRFDHPPRELSATTTEGGERRVGTVADRQTGPWSGTTLHGDRRGPTFDELLDQLLDDVDALLEPD